MVGDFGFAQVRIRNRIGISYLAGTHIIESVFTVVECLSACIRADRYKLRRHCVKDFAIGKINAVRCRGSRVYIGRIRCIVRIKFNGVACQVFSADFKLEELIIFPFQCNFQLFPGCLFSYLVVFSFFVFEIFNSRNSGIRITDRISICDFVGTYIVESIFTVKELRSSCI